MSEAAQSKIVHDARVLENPFAFLHMLNTHTGNAVRGDPLYLAALEENASTGWSVHTRDSA
jgi:hypothetical protein